MEACLNAVSHQVGPTRCAQHVGRNDDAEMREERRRRTPGKLIRTAVINARTEIFNENMTAESLDAAMNLFR